MSETLYDIAVIGGGASGMIAALSAAKTAPQLRIAVLERQNRVGKKLLATGNGRCNLTNMNASEKNYHGSVSFMRYAMNEYPPEAVLAFFKDLGVYPREEEDGRVYPMSDQASSVLDALRLSMEESGVEEICDFEAASVTRSREGYRITAKDNRQITAKRIICAAGGSASPSLGGSGTGYRLLESCGHELTPRFPALVQLKANPEYTKPLKGTKYAGDIDLLVGGRIRRTETGEILFTEYGLSGIAVMQLSRIAAQEFTQRRPQKVEARLHLLPMSEEEALRLLRDRRRALSRRTLENFLTGLINKRAGQMLVKWNTGLSLSEPAASLTDEQLAALAHALTGWTLEITGTQGFEQAQVTAGGVKTQDVNPETMESLLADGLYITGEILDIDGDCGGFNLQWAWASGLLAGESCARSLTGGPRRPSADHPAPRPERNTPLPERSETARTAPDKRYASDKASRRPAPDRRPFSDPSARFSSDNRHPAGKPSRTEEKRYDPPRKPSQPSKGMRKPHD